MINITIRSIDIGGYCERSILGVPARRVHISYYFKEGGPEERKKVKAGEFDKENVTRIIDVPEDHYQEMIKEGKFYDFLKEEVLKGIGEILIIREDEISLNEKLLDRFKNTWYEEEIEIKKGGKR